jgi:hypothetical protein
MAPAQPCVCVVGRGQDGCCPLLIHAGAACCTRVLGLQIGKRKMSLTPLVPAET